MRLSAAGPTTVQPAASWETLISSRPSSGSITAKGLPASAAAAARATAAAVDDHRPASRDAAAPAFRARDVVSSAPSAGRPRTSARANAAYDLATRTSHIHSPASRDRADPRADGRLGIALQFARAPPAR